jgi:SAM-dependent MidA family methyltransferase
MADLAALLARHCGMALVVDYGGWGSRGDTLQALRGHVFADPLAEPGLADLTAHVDFRALAEAAAVPYRLVDQGSFLERLGITARAQALAARMTGPALDAHVAAHRRLTHPSEMGSLFKVLGLYPSGHPAPAGTA